MPKYCLTVLLLFACIPLRAETIYKWVGSDGVVHYSDMPRDGADKLELGPVQTFSPPPPPQPRAAEDGVTAEADAVDGGESDFAAYELIEVTSPSQEETIWNTGGKVTVATRLQPGLQAGHQMRLFMDGEQLADLPPGSANVQLSEVLRGEHQIWAEVVDANGQVLISSSPVKFFYQQTSVNRRPGRR